jgi:hypothetical protein
MALLLEQEILVPMEEIQLLLILLHRELSKAMVVVEVVEKVQVLSAILMLVQVLLVDQVAQEVTHLHYLLPAHLKINQVNQPLVDLLQTMEILAEMVALLVQSAVKEEVVVVPVVQELTHSKFQEMEMVEVMVVLESVHRLVLGCQSH